MTDLDIIIWFWVSTLIMTGLGFWAGHSLTPDRLPRGASKRKG